MSYLFIIIVLTYSSMAITGLGLFGHQFFKMRELDKKTGRGLTWKDLWLNLLIAFIVGFVGGIFFFYTWWIAIDHHIFCNSH